MTSSFPCLGDRVEDRVWSACEALLGKTPAGRPASDEAAVVNR